MSLLYMKGWGMNTNVNGRGWALVCAVVMGASAAVGQATQPSAGGASAAEEKGRAVVRGAIEHLQHMGSCTLQARWRQETSRRGMGKWEETIYEVRMERPGKFLLRPTQSPGGAGTVVCDGQTMTASLPGAGSVIYVQQRVGDEGRMREVTKNQDLQFAMGPAGGWMSMLIEPEVGMQQLERAKSVEWVGVENVEGQACDCVRVDLGWTLLTQVEVEPWELWITRGDEPVVVRARWRRTVGNYHSEANKTTVVDVVTFEDWRVNPPLEQAYFASDPPEWGEQVESFADRFARPASPAGPWMGQEAPTFAAKTLDGKMVDLAALRGKEVVVLEFWATWCSPCVQSLPDLQRVAEGYADRPVSVLAVNDGEDAATIRKFLEEKGLKLTVVMDEQGQIVRLYGVSALPRTVVIGMDGKVVLDATGYSPVYAQEIREAVDKALAAGPSEQEKQGQAGAKQGAPARRAPR